MKKIIVVTMQKNKGDDQSFEVGAFLMDGEEKTSVSVTKITCFFGVVRVHISDGRVFIFRGFPSIVVKK